MFDLETVLFVFECVTVSLLCNDVRHVRGKYVEGHLKTSEDWAFLSRFCFLSEEGQFNYTIEYELDYAVQNLLLYYDTPQQWTSVYRTKKTCVEKESVLNLTQNQVINLTHVGFGGTFSGCTFTKTRKGKGWLRCNHVRRFRSARERWWFLAVSNCNATKGLDIRFKFLMTNGQPGDYWHYHFSADEFYILPNLIGFCVMYLLMILGIIICTVELKSRQLFHTTYKLFVTSVALQEAGTILLSISYLKYASDGMGFPRIHTFGRMLESSSETVYLLLLLLLAKGFTVTRGRLRLASSVKLTIFMCVYVVTYSTLFIYEQAFFDPGKVLYLYESPAGYGLMFLRLIAWGMFVYSIVFTLKHYPEKAKFYYVFNIVGTLWFMAGPIFISIATNHIDKWVRESVVCGVLHFMALSGHVLFLLLTLPSRANKIFPYHVRTTQVGVLEVVRGDAEPSGDFNHHMYAPERTRAAPIYRRPTLGEWVTDVPIELFSVSRNVATTTMAVPRTIDLTATGDVRQVTSLYEEHDGSRTAEHKDIFQVPSAPVLEEQTHRPP